MTLLESWENLETTFAPSTQSLVLFFIGGTNLTNKIDFFFGSSKTTCIKVASFTLRRWCLPFVGCKCAWSIHVSSGWCGERKTKTRWVSFSPNIFDFCHLFVSSVLQPLVPLLSLGFREIHSFVGVCNILILWCLCCDYVKIRVLIQCPLCKVRTIFSVLW